MFSFGRKNLSEDEIQAFFRDQATDSSDATLTLLLLPQVSLEKTSHIGQK